MSDSISDEEAWIAATRDIKKFDKKTPKNGLPLPLQIPRPSFEREHFFISHRESYADLSLSYLKCGDVSGMDKRTAKAFKQGKYPIDRSVDLHGRTREQAYLSLHHFMLQSYKDGKRCVLVVTGKGDPRNGKPGVIRESFSEWLNLEELRPLVVSYCYAAPQHGGTGAVYILLRRRR